MISRYSLHFELLFHPNYTDRTIVGESRPCVQEDGPLTPLTSLLVKTQFRENVTALELLIAFSPFDAIEFRSSLVRPLLSPERRIGI